MLLSVCFAIPSLAEERDENIAVIEVGAAAARIIREAGWSRGADFALEFTLIENWLEIEAGTTPMFSRDSIESDTALLFKKPWALSRNIEFMAGAGPAWVYTRSNGKATNSAAAEFVLDFMFWRSPNHRFGWFIEPGYEYSFGPKHERSVGVSFGLLIGLNRQ
jgi:hypothetical protein